MEENEKDLFTEIPLADVNGKEFNWRQTLHEFLMLIVEGVLLKEEPRPMSRTRMMATTQDRHRKGPVMIAGPFLLGAHFITIIFRHSAYCPALNR